MEISPQELSKHNKEGDCWIEVDGVVYDVTKFAEFHPGGKSLLLNNGGKDLTNEFHYYHGDSVLVKYGDKLRVGKVKGKEPRQFENMPGTFGDMIPYGDPSWYQRLRSPYYKQTHIDFRNRVRKFIDEEIISTMSQWKDSDKPPADLYRKMGKAGLLACMVGTPFPKDYVDPGTPIVEDFDHFHEFIIFDELSRCGNSGVIAALSNGPAIALSAVWKFGTPEMKKRVVRPVIMGEEFIALAITEPNAGSDVSNAACRAELVGDTYYVTGNKKYITNGTYARWFVVVVVTDGKGGHSGQSVLLVERDAPGFSVRKIKVRGSDISGTSYLDFYKTPVPASNLIGKRGNGFKQIMDNMNHERMYVTVCACRLSRVCLEESIKYALKRKTFGKELSTQPVIQAKIAAMARAIESLSAWLELLVYNMNQMSHQEAMMKLGDITALVKVQGSKVYEFVARETTMIFGGNAIMQGSLGEKIEVAVSQVKGYQIPAGAEDILDNFSGKTAFRLAKQFGKL